MAPRVDGTAAAEAGRQDALAAPPGSVPAGIASWIRSGGTQRDDGSYAGWLDDATGALSPPYPEITGYVLGFLASAAAAAPDGDRGRGQAAADWLSARVLRGDLSARPSMTGATVHTFDVAMACHGLLRWGDVVPSERVVSAGLACASHLLRLEDEHGTLPCLDPATVTGAVAPAWSTTGTAHLLKCVQALLSADRAGLPGAAECAGRVVRAELDRWQGAVPPRTCPDGHMLGLHALCYAAEGLWVWGAWSRDEHALAASRDLTRWLWDRRLEDGGFPAFATPGGRAVVHQRQSDVSAQVLRLVQLHPDLGIDVGTELARLQADAWVRGPHAGLLYRPGSADRHVSCWASMFGYQALRLSQPGATLPWSELV